MCGIAGIIGEATGAQALIDAIAHRGPNGIRVEESDKYSSPTRASRSSISKAAGNLCTPQAQPSSATARSTTTSNSPKSFS
ncbi:MAG: hypothetical protein R3C30_15710 [Hyphomonadaceae bacterium]